MDKKKSAVKTSATASSTEKMISVGNHPSTDGNHERIMISNKPKISFSIDSIVNSSSSSNNYVSTHSRNNTPDGPDDLTPNNHASSSSTPPHHPPSPSVSPSSSSSSSFSSEKRNSSLHQQNLIFNLSQDTQGHDAHRNFPSHIPPHLQNFMSQHDHRTSNQFIHGASATDSSASSGGSAGLASLYPWFRYSSIPGNPDLSLFPLRYSNQS